jgi:glycosyltransferase involved in cell wall biosynthesis
MDLGIPEKKIVVIPLGVDLELFTPAQEDDKIKIRQKLGLPEDKTIIGSFQKDGVGWEDGLEPKLVKGPDIFCDAVEQLARDHKIHVLLTGPARGYVKKRLDQASISYSHFNLENYRQIPDYYRALDIYLITSRVEGGPLALFEAWASGIPLVSTKVGLVPDLATDGKNILLSDIEDVSVIAKQADRLVSNQKLRTDITTQALEEVKKYSWQTIAEQYNKYLYSNAD